MDPTTPAKTYAGVDVSKDQLDVFVRHGEAGRNRSGVTFAVTHDVTLGSMPWSLAPG